MIVKQNGALRTNNVPTPNSLKNHYRPDIYNCILDNRLSLNNSEVIFTVCIRNTSNNIGFYWSLPHIVEIIMHITKNYYNASCFLQILDYVKALGCYKVHPTIQITWKCIDKQCFFLQFTYCHKRKIIIYK